MAQSYSPHSTGSHRRRRATASAAAVSSVNQSFDPFPPPAHTCETAGTNGGTIGTMGRGLSMRILLAAQAGLFSDAFCGSLAKLARQVEVERCDPDRLQDPDPEARFALVLIDADAAPGRAAALVHTCRERLPDVPIVALGSSLDEALIAGIMDAGAETYFPKTYREVQALGVLQVVLGGTNHGPHAERGHVAPRAAAGPMPIASLFGSCRS